MEIPASKLFSNITYQNYNLTTYYLVIRSGVVRKFSKQNIFLLKQIGTSRN